MTARRFNNAGQLTKAGQRHWALKVIRELMRDYAKERRLSLRITGSSIALIGAIRVAQTCELISDSRARRLRGRLDRITHAAITRRPSHVAFRIINSAVNT